MGNVLLRPVLRQHEIPFLGVSGAPPENHIPISDLLVAIDGARVVLRSRSLGCEVIPRLTSAHNYSLRSLGIYNFLCSLQEQGVTSVDWSWGPLDAAEFLPRVVSGKVVLAPARWRLARKRLSALTAQKGKMLYAAVQALRAELGLPRHIALVDGNNALPIDLDNILSVDAFTQMVSNRQEAILRELAPAPEELCVRGPEGRYVHELLIPFVRCDLPVVNSVVSVTPPSIAQRTFAPGSEWLTVKLYAGATVIDTVLAEAIAVIRRAQMSGAADGWFFIRYGDPDWHLRLRVHGHPLRLCAEVLPALHAVIQPLLADGRVWKVQVDTYDRELERYGGVEGTLICERIFQADSEAALAIVTKTSAGDDAGNRWRSALLGVDRLFEDFGFDLPARRDIAQHLRDTCFDELRGDIHLERSLGAKFRRERSALERLLAPGADSQTHRILAERSRALSVSISDLRASEVDLERVAASIIHMSTNRLLRSSGRAQELVIYNFLERLYQSRLASPRTRPADREA
jgi:thiopeptide-type bacteriocin biosynthesis protein